jgi:outer membrane protein OmpA-like peptidoglycan-associated protein
MTFSCLADNGLHQEAFGMMVQGKTKDCYGADFQIRKIRIFISNKKFEEAQFALKDFESAFPDDPRYEIEISRWIELKDLHDNPLPLEIIFLSDQNSNDNEMIGWIDAGAPVSLSDKGGYVNHFPNKRESTGGYDFLELKNGGNSRQHQDIINRFDAETYRHVGPGQILADSVILYTAVDGSPYKLGESSGKLQIYQFDLRRPGSKPVLLSVCEEGYNDAFPVFNKETNTLYFSSDRPGGCGGMDIWQSVFFQDKWTEPLRLPDVVNTPANEMFPEILRDTLFFSSDRKDLGFGGMDIYGYDLKNEKIWNLGSPVNTEFHDFRISFASDNEAFFVTNRPAAMNGDNIFRIKWSRKELFFDELILEGDWLKSAVGKQVVLLDKVTLAKHTAIVDSKGKVRFYNIKGQSDFELEFPDIEMTKGAKLTMSGSDGNLIREVISDGRGRFIFELLTPQDYYIEKMQNDELISMNSDVVRRLVGLMDVHYRKVHIVLTDVNGEPVGNVQTTSEGKLIFESESENGRLKVNCEVTNTNDIINIYGSKGNLIKSLKPEELSENLNLELDGDEVEITFSNIQYAYEITDWKTYHIRPVYYKFDKAGVENRGVSSINEAVRILLENSDLMIELSGHTDSRGSSDYNVNLSRKRIQAVKIQLMASGISANRIIEHAYGESEIVNRCSDGVKCSEDEHAMNRRTELKFIETISITEKAVVESNGELSN